MNCTRLHVSDEHQVCSEPSNLPMPHCNRHFFSSGANLFNPGMRQLYSLCKFGQGLRDFRLFSYFDKREAASLSNRKVQSVCACNKEAGQAVVRSPSIAAFIASALCFPVANRRTLRDCKMVPTPEVSAHRGTSLGSLKKRPAGKRNGVERRISTVAVGLDGGRG